MTIRFWGKCLLAITYFLTTHTVKQWFLATVPLSAIYPSYRDVLQDHNHSEGQTSRVVIKHGDKVVP